MTNVKISTSDDVATDGAWELLLSGCCKDNAPMALGKPWSGFHQRSRTMLMETPPKRGGAFLCPTSFGTALSSFRFWMGIGKWQTGQAPTSNAGAATKFGRIVSLAAGGFERFDGLLRFIRRAFKTLIEFMG